MYLADRVADIISRFGESCTLQRSGLADLPLKAKRLMKSRKGGQEIVGDFADADLVFRIGNAEIAAAAGWTVPQRLDTLIDSLGNPYKVMHVDSRLHAGQALQHLLYVSGG